MPVRILTSGRGSSGESGLIPEPEIAGIDRAQRKLIYSRFKTVPWSDHLRPPVHDYKDLIEFWGAERTLLGPYQSR